MRPRVLRTTFASFALLFAPFASTQTTLTIDPSPLHTHVKRLGINLSGQTFYDSGQLLRNLTFRNPGFEGGTWQSILHCKIVTPTTCTDDNAYTVWPAGFLNGAHFEFLSGRSGAGTVRSSSAVSLNQGVTVVLENPPRPPAAGDFLLVRNDKPGKPEAGWWPDLAGGATLAAETHDLSPASPGKQALRIDASRPGQTAKVSSYFDSYNGRSFLQMRGHFTLSFRARPLSGSPSVAVKIERLDTTHGLQSFFARPVPLAPGWHDYTFDFNAQEDGTALGTIGLTFTFAGTSALLDDVALTAAAAPDNPTAFRDEVVDTLRDLRPGVLRYMDNGTNFGSSLANLLAPPYARQRTGASTQESLREDIPIGLHEFLVLAKAVHAEPWFSMPPGTSPEEAANLIQYLAGPPETLWGAIRARLGQREPWSAVFPQIHLELGNEQWNARSFAGATIADPTAYGQRAARIFTAMRATPAFDAARFDLILGSWATVPWWTNQEMTSSRAFDSVAVAPYLFNEFNDAKSPEAIFGPMLAQPEMIDSRPDGYMAQQAATLRKAAAAASKGASVGQQPRETNPSQEIGFSPGLAVYEVNLGSMSGTVDQSALDRAIPSLGAGLAVADHMLLMLRDLGVVTQCLFALPEYSNDFQSPTQPRKHIPLWGAVVDMGGPTNLRRPQFLATQLINAAILPTMLTTHLTGQNPTWNQALSSNDKILLDNVHLLQTFAFADGPRHSLILLNLSRTDALPVNFAGPLQPTGRIEEARLTSAHITDTNETAATVTIKRRTLPLPAGNAPYLLPPHSLTTLTWTAH